MSVESVLHKVANELNRPEWHAEIDAADTPVTETEEPVSHA